jgi:hypothetical protein
MTRSEYFIQIRIVLQELDDRALGIFLWHCSGPFPHSSVEIPPAFDILELYNRLFPNFNPEQASEKIGAKPDIQSLRRVIDYRTKDLISTLKGQKLERYESAVLAIGQCARDLLLGDSTALWNVAEMRRRQLDKEWINLHEWATQAEHNATVARQRADSVRIQLDIVLEELRRLSQVKNSLNS